jgi:hypothetical protein
MSTPADRKPNVKAREPSLAQQLILIRVNVKKIKAKRCKKAIKSPAMKRRRIYCGIDIYCGTFMINSYIK